MKRAYVRLPKMAKWSVNTNMSVSLIFALTIYTGLSVMGLYKLKLAASFLSWSFVLGFAMYGVGFLIWLYMLKKFPLSLIFPLCASCILIGTQLVGWFLIHEAITPKKIFAVLCALMATVLIYLEME